MRLWWIMERRANCRNVGYYTTQSTDRKPRSTEIVRNTNQFSRFVCTTEIYIFAIAHTQFDIKFKNRSRIRGSNSKAKAKTKLRRRMIISTLIISSHSFGTREFRGQQGGRGLPSFFQLQCKITKSTGTWNEIVVTHSLFGRQRLRRLIDWWACTFEAFFLMSSFVWLQYFVCA